MIYEIETQQGLAKLHRKTPDSKGSPVLFIHGFGSNAQVWFAYDDSLGNYYKTLQMDCWTLNLSNAVTGNIKTLAHEDVLTAVDFIYKKRGETVLIISHSMGGIISRYFTSPYVDHPYPLKQIESMIRAIALLTVPNHGVEAGDISRIEETVNVLRKFLSEDHKPLAADLGLGFFQLTHTSHLLQSLNTLPPLNPNLLWLNAVGTYDKVVPRNSALFEEFEYKTLQNFSQKEFPCDHMVYPFTSAIKKVIKAIPDFIESAKHAIKIYPAIHRHQPVGDWILEKIQ
ncbi:MAG: alpha/beta hydrolase [Candidatus Heimdallarchaeota archaeon]|nr:MAG: alpha/beta hydrolase [Candidatus Heimdallarchaeota archaeon]